MKKGKVIPDGWSEHHAPVAESFMTALCRIHEADTVGTWPDYEVIPGAQYYPSGDEPGICSAQALGTGADSIAVEATITKRTYLVSIPLPGPQLKAGEGAPYVTITACPDDPNLVGRTLSIEDIQHGSTNWTRDLICVEELTSNNPGEG